MKLKQKIQYFLPPIIVNFLKRVLPKRYGWKGDYASWQEAENTSSGYDSSEILKRVKNSTLKVKKGEAVYERDSVLFKKIQYSWPLLSGLMLAAAKSSGSLRVLDFGGSLGSTYFQNKRFLDKLDRVSWSIVEQNHFVEVGREEFEDERLKFYYNISECVKNENPNVLILSGVLQYIEKPIEILQEILKYGFDIVLIDLTAVSSKNQRLTIQVVKPEISKASYPCWMLDESKIKKVFKNNNYSSLEKFKPLDGFEIFRRGKKIAEYIGEIWVKIK